MDLVYGRTGTYLAAPILQGDSWIESAVCSLAIDVETPSIAGRIINL